MSLLTIAAKDIKQYIGEDTIIIDLREPEEYTRGHIPNAVNIPFEGVNETKMNYPKDKILILYCDRGNASLLIGREWSKMGYSIINIYGGYRAYRG